MGHRLKILLSILVLLAVGSSVWFIFFNRPDLEAIELGAVGTRLTVCKESKQIATNFASATFATYLTLSCTAPATGDYYVIGSLGTGVTSLSSKPIAKLVVNGVDEITYSGGLTLSATVTGGQGVPFNFVRRVSLTAGANTILIQVANSTAIGATQALNASLIALEASSDSSYGQDLGTTYCTDVLTTDLDVASTTVTEISPTDYLLLWSWQGYHEDESDGGSGVKFGYSSEAAPSPQFFQKSNSADLDTASNNNVDYSQGGMALFTVPASDPTTFSIFGSGGSSIAETCTKKAGVVAIPFYDFMETYTDSTNGVTKHRASYANSNISVSQTLANTDYLIFANAVSSNESVNEAGSWRLSATRNGATFTTPQMLNMEDRLWSAGISESFLGFYGYATTTYGSATYAFTIQGRSSLNLTTTEGALIDNSYLFVGRVRPPGNATPVIETVVYGPDPVNVGATEIFDTYWTDEDNEAGTILLCKTNSVTGAACTGGNWCTAASSLITPARCNYTALVGDIGVKNFHAFACDDEISCSTVHSGTFTVQAAPDPSADFRINNGELRVNNGEWRQK